MSCNKSKLRARLRREAQAINERNRVPGDLYYKEPAPPPEQPAREGDEWCIGSRWHRWQEGHGYYRDITTVSGKRIYPAATEAEMNAVAEQIVTDHARAALVPGLVEALNGLGWHSQNKVDSCWCHVKSEPYADHTKQCEQIQVLIAAARKAGVE